MPLFYFNTQLQNVWTFTEVSIRTYQADIYVLLKIPGNMLSNMHQYKRNNTYSCSDESIRDQREIIGVYKLCLYCLATWYGQAILYGL